MSANTGSIRKTVWTLLGFALVYTAFFMLANGEPGRGSWWSLALVFYGWAGSPFILLGLQVRPHGKSRPYLRVLLATTVILVFGGLVALWRTFVTQPDPQGGLVFVFLPLLQLVVAFIGLGVAALVESSGRAS